MDQEETEILFHLIKNRNTDINTSTKHTNELVDKACSNVEKQRLAKISEEQNFLNKNRFYIDKTLMNYADKKRMPIDEIKVKDMLRNQHIVRAKIAKEVNTYQKWQDNTNFESGVLTYVNEAAWGDLRDLLKDIGINRETIRYTNVADAIEAKDNRVYESDINFKNLINARYTMIDMTEYEHTYPGFNENGDIPISNLGYIQMLKPEPFPQVNSYAETLPMEKWKPNTLGTTHRGILEEAAAAAEAEEEEDEDEDEDDDEDEEEEEGDEEEEEGDEEEEEEDAEPEIPADFIMPRKHDDRYFKHGENIRERFNEVELDGFMKLLNMRPHVQWQDDTVHHYKAGIHSYEDEAQMTDPYYSLLAEVERKYLQRNQASNFRSGTEIKIIPDRKKAPVFSRQ